MIKRKIFLWTALFCFLFSSSGKTQGRYFYHILDFSKGLNTHINLWNLSDNQASVARNVRFNKKYSSLSKRTSMIGVGTTGAANTSMHRYYQSDTTGQLLVTGSTVLELRDDDDNSMSNIKTGLTDGKRWTWSTYKNKAIGCNGYDNNIKYDGSTSITANTDGHRTAENLCADLGAPFAELNTGTDLDASSWYQYKIAWYDGSTYSYSTARSNAIQTGAAVYNIALTDIPIGPSGTTHRYIYRTVGNASKAAVEADTTFYLVGTLANNTATTFSDDVSDDTADDDAAPTWATAAAGSNVTPPKGKYCLIHNNRFFVAGNTTYPSYLYWSDAYNPDYFPLASYDRIRPDDGDVITFLREEGNILVIGKTNTLQNYYTTAASESDWYPSNPFSFDGCIAPYSVSNTPKGTFYLGWKGLYRYGGQNSQLISDAITPEINDILATALDDVFGYYWENEYHLAYTSSESGEYINNRVLVYDIIRDAYALDYKNINCFCAFSSGSDSGILHSGSSDSDGQIYAFEGSSEDFIKRYKSELDAGTFSYTVTSGTENAPILDIGWDITINEAVGTIDGHSYGADAIIDRPTTTGYWESEVYQVNATALTSLYWNESLGDTGNVTVQLKTGASVAACNAASYDTAYSNPSGSDISSETANTYIKFKINLTTTDVNYSPYLYVTDGYLLKMEYNKEGSSAESDFLSLWQGGWENLGINKKKIIDRIKIYYSGDTGTIAVGYKNEEGDTDTSFDIDLTQTAGQIELATGNKYLGIENEKIYIYYPPKNEEGQTPIGQWWMFNVSEIGSDEWIVHRIEVRYEIEEGIYD